MKSSAKSYFDFIKPVVLEVGEYLEGHRQNIHVVKSKTDKLDIQTDVDLGAEKIYLEAIKNKFPDHTIVSEESLTRNQTDFVWYIDPLDCTKEFFRGISLYNTCVTLEFQHKNILSVIYRPTDKELYYTYDGKSFLNGSPCLLSKTNSLNEAIVYLYLPHARDKSGMKKFEEVFAKIVRISAHAYRVRGMADENSAMCYVASGKCEAFVDLYNPNAGWWDWCGGIEMVKNAGGKATDSQGAAIKNQETHNGIIVSNGLIHKELLEIINN